MSLGPERSTQMNIRHASDLVRDAKLQTSFRNDITHHVYYTSITSARRRKVKVEEKWKRQQELGNGTYGRVWLETCIQGPKAGEYRAVKEISKEQEPGREIDYEKELEAITKFSHQNYVHCFVQSFGWYENERFVYITMEYMEHGDLQKRLGRRFPEPEVQAVALQLIEGLQFMHDNGFTHRDLKPGNILVLQPAPEWWVKIADFGISKRAEEGSTALRTQVGTRGYLAPEVIGIYPVSDITTSGRADTSYTSAVDMWALGEICFRMITNNQPVFSSPRDLFNYVTHGSEFPASPLLAANASHNSIEFIKITMDPSPAKRISATDALLYPWIESAQETARRSLSEGRPSLEQPPLISQEFQATASWSTHNHSLTQTLGARVLDISQNGESQELQKEPSLEPSAIWSTSKSLMPAPVDSRLDIDLVT